MHGFRLLAILSIAAVLPLMAERTAHAYGDLTVHYARVDTSNCARLSGDLPVIAFSNGCQLDDSVDGTFFEKDVGGIAVKLELHDDNGMVAKVEFHPLGEKLWVYDTRNDSDTVYVQVCQEEGGPGSTCFFIGPAHSAPGTSNVIDKTVDDIREGENFPEGVRLGFKVTDDLDGNDGFSFFEDILYIFGRS